MSLRRSAFGLLLLLAGCLHTPGPSKQALYNNEQCVHELNKGNYEQATIYCDLGLEFAPQYADLWNNKGLISLYTGHLDEARQHFIKAIRFNQEHAAAYTNLGRIYLEQGAHAQARTQFERALKVDPNYIEARYNLGLSYSRTNQFAEARKEFKTLLTVDPNNAQVHHDLGIVLYRQGELVEAQRELLQTVQLAPGLNADWWNDLGALQMELGRFADAAQSFGSCLALKPDHSQCLGNLEVARSKAALMNVGQES